MAGSNVHAGDVRGGRKADLRRTKDPRLQAQEVARHMQELLSAPGWLEERINLLAEGGFTPRPPS